MPRFTGGRVRRSRWLAPVTWPRPPPLFHATPAKHRVMLVDLRESDESELVQVVLAWRRDARSRGMDPGRVTPDSVVRSLIRREFEKGLISLC